MVDETIEVCSRCGKLPRSIDFDVSMGNFRCSRCGGAELMVVTSSEYEGVVFELEEKFTREAIKKRAPPDIEEQASEDIESYPKPTVVETRPQSVNPAQRQVIPAKSFKESPKPRKKMKKLAKKVSKKSIRLKAKKAKPSTKPKKKKTRKR